MRKNTHPEFVGIEDLKGRQREQLRGFRAAAAGRDWSGVHTDHFDWWMFPIDRPSSFGYMWTVFETEVTALKRDASWISDYLCGIRIAALAWGWDLGAEMPVADPDPDQAWTDIPVRLEKVTRSLELFGCSTELRSLSRFAAHLMHEGWSMIDDHGDFTESLRSRGRRAIEGNEL